jgi:hypothetical protein
MRHGLNPADPASFERLEALIARIREEWVDDPNVLDIVPAIKVRGRVAEPDSLVIGFHVAEKVPLELLEDRGLRRIPDEIGGIPTDVVLARQPPHDGSIDEKNTRSQMFDTLIGGIAVGNANMNVYGTLTMMLLANSDGRMVGLTNEHVLVYDGDGHIGDEVQQPRFYLNSEVSLDTASCCPNGVLHYRGVDNPVVDAAAAVFAAAALAAALSDEIDPTRRGQEATVPDADETTVREVVSVSLDYPQIPLPGTPYSVKVDWSYDRLTDRQTRTHAVSETQTNQHVLQSQHLLTDRREYARGQTVTFLALLEEPGREGPCRRRFVTAAALSPSHRRAYKVILRPYELQAEIERQRAIAHGSAGHIFQDGSVRRCFAFDHQKPGSKFHAPRVIDGLRYDPEQATATFVHDASGAMALELPARGIVITLPTAVEIATVRLWIRGPEPVTVRGFDGASEVAVEQAVPANVPGDATVTLAAQAINRLVIGTSKPPALLQELCLEKGITQPCLYRGTLELASDEELGFWSTYLFAQTLNDVAVGTDPLIAAQTIGGLPLTNNFTFVGDTDSVTYGHACNVDVVSDGSFEVIAPPAVG